MEIRILLLEETWVKWTPDMSRTQQHFMVLHHAKGIFHSKLIILWTQMRENSMVLIPGRVIVLQELLPEIH